MIGPDPLPTPAAPDVQATFCATLVDEWVRHGLRHAVIAPGSRSTPLAVAVAARDEIDVHVVHDERVAGFIALGLGLDGTPALLLCTSGTAAANFFPAVVEAGLSNVAMLVVTADRPEELRGVGAPQTIDQIELYGTHVRWFRDPGVAAWSDRGEWRSLARTAQASASSGPVQLNLAFREPLLGQRCELPPADAATVDAATVDAATVDGADGPTADRTGLRAHDVAPSGGLRAALSSPRGLILAGGRSGVAELDVVALHGATGWPILADPLSGLRHLDEVVTTADALLRDASMSARRPEIVVRLGRPSTSKVLAQWVDGAVRDGATLVQVGGPGRIDPGHNVTAVCAIGDVLALARPTVEPAWARGWAEAERRAGAAIADALDQLASAGEATEPGVARTVVDSLPPGAELVVASSMPVRDVEWFGGRNARAHCNRGANGIDGVVSTALGRALGGRPVVVLVGDLAFVHDSTALTALMQRDVDLRIVVVDNDGGGIFSFLPQAEALTHDRFEQLFGTPLGVDTLALAGAHGIPTHEIGSLDHLDSLVPTPGPWVARVRTERTRNVEVHHLLNEVVGAAL